MKIYRIDSNPLSNLEKDLLNQFSGEIEMLPENLVKKWKKTPLSDKLSFDLLHEILEWTLEGNPTPENRMVIINGELGHTLALVNYFICRKIPVYHTVRNKEEVVCFREYVEFPLEEKIW